MLFLEDHARFWLIVHAVVGAATVAVTTHLVVWIRRYPRGDFARHSAARWFATAALLLYGSQFTLGNLLYPTYKVRVRAEYFDLPPAAREERRIRQEARREIDARARSASAPIEASRDLPALGRLFDVKEHGAAVGLAAAFGLAVLAWAWDPRRDGEGGTSLFLSLVVACAGCAWLAGLVGLFVSSHRAVGWP